MNTTKMINNQFPGITLKQLLIPAFQVLKAILVGIPIIWLPILWMMLLEFGDGYMREFEETLFVDLYMLPVLKCLVVFPFLGIFLRYLMKVKSIRLSPVFPYPFLLAIGLFWILFSVVSTLPRLADDPVVYFRIVGMQLATAVIIFPLFLGKRGILFSLLAYAMVSFGFWYASSQDFAQDHWLMSQSRSVEFLLTFFSSAIFYTLLFLVIDYFRQGPNFPSILIFGNVDRFESLEQAKFDQWPLWRKLNWDPFTPMQIILGLAVYLYYLSMMLSRPEMSFAYGWMLIAFFTLMSVRLHWSLNSMRTQCRRLWLQSPEASRKRFFQHYIGFEILRFLPVLLSYLILAAVVSIALERNYWWICIFSLIAYLLSWLGGMQLLQLKVGKLAALHIAWIVISFIISLSLINYGWRDDVFVMGLFVLLILLMSLLLYLNIKRFCASDLEF